MSGAAVGAATAVAGFVDHAVIRTATIARRARVLFIATPLALGTGFSAPEEFDAAPIQGFPAPDVRADEREQFFAAVVGNLVTAGGEHLVVPLADVDVGVDLAFEAIAFEAHFGGDEHSAGTEL